MNEYFSTKKKTVLYIEKSNKIHEFYNFKQILSFIKSIIRYVGLYFATRALCKCAGKKPKEAIMKSIKIIMILLLLSSGNLFAFFWNDDGSSSDGTSENPYELAIDGDKRDDDSPTSYYKFVSLAEQNVTVHIADHKVCIMSACSATDRDLKITLYHLNDDGSCDTSSVIDTKTESGNFDWSFGVDGGKSYCLETFEDLEMMDTASKYDINLTGDAVLKAGISDASKNEDDSPMEFIVALTKVATSDVTINYTFHDGSAVNGENYEGTNGSVTISKGEQSATISVPLKDTDMSGTKDFTVTITSDDVSIDSDSSTATGTIMGSGGSSTADDNYNGPDICYDSRKTSGFCMFGSCIFYKETTNVHAMVDGLSDIDIKKALTRGMAFMDFASGIGIDDTSKTLEVGDDQAEKKDFASVDFQESSFFNVSMFPKGIQYRIGDGADENNGGSMNKDDRTSYYDKSMFKLGLFTQYTTLVTYTKGGKTYQEVLQPCNPDTYGALDPKPVLNHCGIFLGALNSNTKITFNSTNQVVPFQEKLYTPEINGTATCENDQPCVAEGTGIGQMTLPEFRSSQVSTTVNVPYSMVIADQQVGSLVFTTDNNTEDPEPERTVVFEAPYSDSYGGRVMFIKSITDEDAHAEHYHYVFKEGDYWIGSWLIDKPADVTIETTGNVRFFINGDLSVTTGGEIRIGYHPGENETSQCDDPHFHMYINGSLSLNATGSAHVRNGYVYTKGNISLAPNGAFASYYTTITADGEVSVSVGGAGSYEANAGSGVCSDDPNSDFFDECPGGGGSALYITGPFDAWDVFRDNMIQPPSDRNISTKIVNEEFQLSLASLNRTNDGYEPKSGDVDVAIYPKNSTDAISNHIIFPAGTAHLHEITPQSFKVTSASKDAVVGFKLCATYENNATTSEVEYVLYPNNACSDDSTLYDCNASTSGTPTWHICYGSDNFAVRPKDFNITEASSAIRAGRGYIYTVTAEQDGGGASEEYNASMSDYDLDLSVTKYMPDGSVNNALHGSVILSGYSFTDGSSSDMNISYDDVGKITLHVQDKNWAEVDADDTPASCDGNTTVPNGMYICGDTNATFVPDHFSLSGVKVYNDHNGSFTYLSNDLNMSSSIEATLMAQNHQNAVTQNFDSASWENPISVDMNVSTTNTPSLNKNTISEQTVGFSSGSYTISWDETNASKNLLFNFNREVNSSINPFEVQGSEVTVSVDSNYSGIIVSGSGVATDKVKFLYAKAHAPKTVSDTNDVSVPIYYEVYCYGTGCDKALLPDGTSSKNSDDPRWWINTAHTSEDGTAGTVEQRSASYVTVISGQSPTGNHPDNVGLHYDGTRGYPYRGVMKIIPDSWLIYNKFNSNADHNEFEVQFNAANGQWAGKNNSESNTKTNSISTKRILTW